MSDTPQPQFHPIVESPALAASRASGRTAFELKVPVDEPTAAAVHSWAAARLLPDPHGDPAQGGSYRTTTLYLDTPEMDVYHRTPGYRRRKYRIRRYGMTTQVFLERKTKGGERVSKRRSALSESELHALGGPEGPDIWPGHWFHRRVLLRRLLPAALVSYRRTAFVGNGGIDGPVRLTLDRSIRGIPTDCWSLFAPNGASGTEWGRPLLTGLVILELKFVESLPTAFKELIADFRLNPGPVSKYRACREAWLGGRDADTSSGNTRA